MRDPDIDIESLDGQLAALTTDGGDDVITLITSLICSLEKNQGHEWLTLPAEATKALTALEPKTYTAAMMGKDQEQWKISINEETDSLLENNTWTVVAGPVRQKVLSGKYVFKIKPDSEGKPGRYKTRWVVRGFEQEYGVDFQETFASVVKPMTYRVLFALATILDWEIEQMDVKTAFLYGLIDTEVYVEMPPNLRSKFPPGSVCKLNKALYGLKQAPRICYDTLCSELRKLGFHSINEDYSLFINNETSLIIGVYVDDLLIMGKDKAAIATLKEDLRKRFKMRTLAPPLFISE